MKTLVEGGAKEVIVILTLYSVRKMPERIGERKWNNIFIISANIVPIVYARLCSTGPLKSSIINSYGFKFCNANSIHVRYLHFFKYKRFNFFSDNNIIH